MKHRIVIIDDNADILYTFAMIAEYAGWETKTEEDPFRGIELIKSWMPHLVIVDYHMPEMNGGEFIKKLREFDKDIPVMVLTVDDNQKLAEKLLKIGATDFALKPLRGPDLIARVSLHLKAQEYEKEEKDRPKGINITTLNMVKNYLIDSGGFVQIDELGESLALSYQSAHRYLAYLEKEGLIELREEYGDVGRPKKKYRWKKTMR